MGWMVSGAARSVVRVRGEGCGEGRGRVMTQRRRERERDRQTDHTSQLMRRRVLAAECWGAECWGAECWGAECWGAECWGAECWGAECWGAECSLPRRVGGGGGSAAPVLTYASPATWWERSLSTGRRARVGARCPRPPRRGSHAPQGRRRTHSPPWRCLWSRRIRHSRRRPR